MKEENPWHIVTRPKALVNLSRPMSSTMIIDRRETNAAERFSLVSILLMIILTFY